jgi:hypothetical protein
VEGFLGQPQAPGALWAWGLPPWDPSPGQGPELTGEDLEGERVLLLDGVGEVEACITAVVSLHVLQHHI